jgi:hypothetical protein
MFIFLFHFVPEVNSSDLSLVQQHVNQLQQRLKCLLHKMTTARALQSALQGHQTYLVPLVTWKQNNCAKTVDSYLRNNPLSERQIASSWTVPRRYNLTEAILDLQLQRTDIFTLFSPAKNTVQWFLFRTVTPQLWIFRQQSL